MLSDQNYVKYLSYFSFLSPVVIKIISVKRSNNWKRMWPILQARKIWNWWSMCAEYLIRIRLKRLWSTTKSILWVYEDFILLPRSKITVAYRIQDIISMENFGCMLALPFRLLLERRSLALIRVYFGIQHYGGNF